MSSRYFRSGHPQQEALKETVSFEACLFLCPLTYEFEDFFAALLLLPNPISKGMRATHGIVVRATQAPSVKPAPSPCYPNPLPHPLDLFLQLARKCRWMAERQEQLAFAERFGSARSEKPCQRPPSSREPFSGILTAAGSLRDVFCSRADDRQQPQL